MIAAQSGQQIGITRHDAGVDQGIVGIGPRETLRGMSPGEGTLVSGQANPEIRAKLDCALCAFKPGREVCLL